MSALHCFGSEKDRISKSMKSGLIRKGKVINPSFPKYYAFLRPKNYTTQFKTL